MFSCEVNLSNCETETTAELAQKPYSCIVMIRYWGGDTSVWFMWNWYLRAPTAPYTAILLCDRILLNTCRHAIHVFCIIPYTENTEVSFWGGRNFFVHNDYLHAYITLRSSWECHAEKILINIWFHTGVYWKVDIGLFMHIADLRKSHKAYSGCTQWYPGSQVGYGKK